MTIVEITGGMLRAARSLTGLSQQELAERASISRPCLTAWEGSSGSVPNAGAPFGTYCHSIRRGAPALGRGCGGAMSDARRSPTHGYEPKGHVGKKTSHMPPSLDDAG